MKCFDLQVNGAFGVDYNAPDLTADDFLRSAEKVLAAGVTRFLPTIITSSMIQYARVLPLLSEAIARAGLGHEIPGLHLEGPFFATEASIGAHNPAWMQRPTPEALHRLNDLAGGKIRLLTVAAEADGVIETAAEARRMGIAVSLGHHLATAAQIRAVDAQALTHFGNGLPNTIPRHCGTVWGALADERLTAMVITDGHHVPPEFITAVLRLKGLERFIVVSDATNAAGMPPGPIRALGNDAILEPNGLLHNPAKGCLVGSASLMPQCLAHLRSLNLLDEAGLEQVAWRNPNRLLGETLE